MFRLGMAIYFMAGVTFAGSAMVAALVTGYDDMQSIIYAVIAGFIVALPVTWAVTKKLLG